MLKILFIPIGAVGHVNSAIGMAQVLAESGHKVIFALNTTWRGKLERYGFEEVLFKQENMKEGVDPAENLALILIEKGMIGKLTPLENALKFAEVMETADHELIKVDKIIEDLLPQINPDVIICDQIWCLPSVEKSGIPWVLVCSCNPLFIIEDERTPPGNSGLFLDGLVWPRFIVILNHITLMIRFTRFGPQK